MREFDKQLERYGDELKNARCPYGDAELDRVIRSVVWNTPGNADVSVRADNIPRTSMKRWIWPSVAAAACIAAVLITLNMPVRANSSIASVDINGEHLYFACNNGCSPEGTLETFKTMIK